MASGDFTEGRGYAEMEDAGDESADIQSEAAIHRGDSSARA